MAAIPSSRGLRNVWLATWTLNYALQLGLEIKTKETEDVTEVVEVAIDVDEEQQMQEEVRQYSETYLKLTSVYLARAA